MQKILCTVLHLLFCSAGLFFSLSLAASVSPSPCLHVFVLWVKNRNPFKNEIEAVPLLSVESARKKRRHRRLTVKYCFLLRRQRQREWHVVVDVVLLFSQFEKEREEEEKEKSELTMSCFSSFNRIKKWAISCSTPLSISPLFNHADQVTYSMANRLDSFYLRLFLPRSLIGEMMVKTTAFVSYCSDLWRARRRRDRVTNIS